MNAQTKAKRQQRLTRYGYWTMYHQTSEEFASKILEEQRMRRGEDGLASGGIYFAKTPEETQDKAQSKGVILEARVYLGWRKYVENEARETTFWNLLNDGFDSICIKGRRSGNEYVVYNYDQVTNITRYTGGAPASPVQPFAPPSRIPSGPPARLLGAAGRGPPLQVGSKVRVRWSISQPKYGWGAVQKGEFGTIVSLNGEEVTVDFPKQSGWRCVRAEITTTP